jgi:glutamate racemase
MEANRPIGVFDSGIGGLTVLKEIIKLLPWEDTIYLGDTARVPYGDKSSETVIRYAIETTDFLLGKNIKLLVVACNTASAVSLPVLKARYRLPILGVIEPGARRAVKKSRAGRVGVIGTERTVKSLAYVRAIHGIEPQIRVFTQSCPLLVPLAEEGWSGNDIALLAARRYLKGFRGGKIDVLVLGCTHYPLLKKVIRKALGPGIPLIDSAMETAREVRAILGQRGMLQKKARSGKRLFYVTDYPERFRLVGRRFLGKKLSKVERIKV